MKNLLDSGLVERARGGDLYALDIVLRRYENKIFSYLCRMLGNRQDAEDATQETLMNAHHALKKYREQGQFRSWIYRIAYREGLRMIRTRKRLPTKETDLSSVIEKGLESMDTAPWPNTQLQHTERVEALEQALNQLPDIERHVILLRIQSDLTFQEIATVTKSPINTVLGRMRNGTLRLKKSFRELQHERALQKKIRFYYIGVMSSKYQKEFMLSNTSKHVHLVKTCWLTLNM